MSDNGLFITMLGTGHATVTKCYNTCFLLREHDRCFMVDAGGGNQILRILEERDISLTQIHDLFITHSHSDHILGVVWIIRRITFFDIKSTKLIQYGFKLAEENLLFCGDEPLNPEFYPEAKGASYLLHEAFCLFSEKNKFGPYEKHHSTVRDVCRTAEELQVKNLILMHTEDSHIADRKKLYTEEGEAFFSGNLWVLDDGESIAVSG